MQDYNINLRDKWAAAGNKRSRTPESDREQLKKIYGKIMKLLIAENVANQFEVFSTGPDFSLRIRCTEKAIKAINQAGFPEIRSIQPRDGGFPKPSGIR